MQDDEYLAALQADREKELKAMEEAAAVREQERQREEESRQKLDAEKVIVIICVSLLCRFFFPSDLFNS